MDRISKESPFNELKIKTGIGYYRAVSFFVFIQTIMLVIFFIVYNSGIIVEFVISSISIISLFTTIFMEKIVYAFHLPTYILVINSKYIQYRKRQFDVEKAILKYHSFKEDFEALSTIELRYDDEVVYIPVTKKQYKEIIDYINKK